MSELYELPDGWEWKKLGDISKIIGGGTPSKKEPLFWNNGNIKWATVGDMNVDVIKDTELSITEKGLKESSSNIISKEAIIVATRVGLGKVCFLESDTAINQDLKGLLPNTKLTSKEYLFYFFKSISNFIIENGTGATVKGVKLAFVKNLTIPLPPLKEQKRIVAKLDTLFEKIDKAITLHQKNMDEADVFMGSVLNEVFGELEERHERQELKDIVRIIGGGTPSKKEPSYWKDGNIKWATVGDMNVETIANTELSITKKGLENSSSNIIPKDGIVIATRVGLGKVCYLKSDTAINQDLKGILPLDDRLSIRYLFNYFKNISQYIISNGTGATVKGIKLEFVKSLNIPLPPLQIQQKTVKYLDQISEKTEILKRVQSDEMENLKALKASILDRAFRGEL